MAATAVKPAQFQEVMRKLESAQKTVSGMKKAGEEQVGEVICGLEMVGAELALGYSRGRNGAWEPGGIPAELIGGLALHLLGFSGIAGKHAQHLHALGNGALGFIAAVEGMKMGEEAKRKNEQAKAGNRDTVETVGENVTQTRSAGREPAPLPERRRTISAVESMADDMTEAAVRNRP